jgi:hypothetical protein
LRTDARGSNLHNQPIDGSVKHLTPGDLMTDRSPLVKDIAKEIRQTVKEASGVLASMDPDAVSRRTQPDRWSKKEILGHLIDSAANNHQRFVRATLHAAASFPTYDQNNWVRIQEYNESEWSALVALWTAYNNHLSDVIARIPADARSSPCNIGRAEPVTLEFVARDYLRHLRHHLSAIQE